MKKQIIAFLLLMVVGAQILTHFGYTKVEATEQKVIPKEAIRLRILANSDSEEDQALKRKVRDRVKAQIDTWVADLKSIDDARRIIRSRLPELEQTVRETLKEEKSNQSFTVEFGKHIKFPTKIYGNFIYPAGEYEAVLVKLGKGEGANWWCVLFPPLCFLDFQSGTAVANAKAAQADESSSKQESKATKADSEVKPQTDASKQDDAKQDEPKREETAVKESKAEAKENKEPAVKSKDDTTAEDQADNQASVDQDNSSDEQPAAEVKNKSDKSQKIVVQEEEEPKVKFFIVEMFSSLFSK